ncbi:MAG: exonuclease domain-containing protein [Chloroflexota bacterium]|jgi:DNA polymerase-3 subunit epsilon
MIDLANARFAFLDLETTGLSPWFGDRICEVGIVLTEGRRIKHTYQTLVNPQRDLSFGAASTNGLSDRELASAPLFPAVAGAVESHLRDAVVVCHNAQFDLQFLDNEFRRLGREIQIPNLVDSLHLARTWFEFPSNTLAAIAEALQVKREQEHRALADAMTLRSLFFQMMDALKSEKRPLDEYIGIYNSPVWPNDGIQLPTELGEAIYSGRRIHITYVDGDGERSERWVTPRQVMGLADYIYLLGYCHLRNAERSFRLDRIVAVRVEEK